jgi:hypothetical protein
VEVLQRHHHVARKVVDRRLGQPHVGAQQAHQVAADAVLQDQPQVVGGLVPWAGGAVGCAFACASGRAGAALRRRLLRARGLPARGRV